MTDAIGLPKGFLDGLYPFSMYQTSPPIQNGGAAGQGMQGMGGMPGMAPQNLSGMPNPINQSLPAPPDLANLLKQLLPGGGGMAAPGGGMPPGMGGPPGMPSMPPGLGMPNPALMGAPPGAGLMQPPSLNPAPQLGAGNPLLPPMRPNSPLLPIPALFRRMGPQPFGQPGAGLHTGAGMPPLPLPPIFHRPRGGGGNRS